MTTITKEQTFANVKLRWDEDGNPVAAMGQFYIKYLEDGVRTSITLTEPVNILKQDFPLQDFLTAAQETAIVKALELAEERDALTAERDETAAALESAEQMLSAAEARIEELETQLSAIAQSEPSEVIL